MAFETLLRLQATFNTLDLPIDVRTFDTRFLIQKNGYFLQEFGADLGYAFGMYVHGPYSPALARDAYALQNLEFEEEEIESVSVSNEARERMRHFIEEVDRLVSPRKEREHWLELLASLHFLCKYSYPKVKTIEDAMEQSKLLRFGHDLETAFDVLRRHNLI